MKKTEKPKTSWSTCTECKGRGKKSQRLSKKVRRQFEKELNEFKELKDQGIAPIRPKAHLNPCSNCNGSGLIQSDNHPTADYENHPHIAIIGGGIGGTALAVACLHRSIPFTLYERDAGFNDRSQGYGLTLQQASKAIKGLGLFSLKNGVVSTRHLVHTTEGDVIGEWGMRKWLKNEKRKPLKSTNIHISRQSLRMALFKQLEGEDAVKWNHQLIELSKSKGKSNLTFLVNGVTKTAKADLVVGADGIRSSVRKLIIGEEISPLRYLNCIVILGICSLQALKNINDPLLDSATVFQTANGNERLYVMPYNSESVMWQLSFPMKENEAQNLSEKGAKALKAEACKRTQWHSPIPQILAATDEAKISGYPVYDRELLDPELLKKCGAITLIGDAAHPMSPFKGQGANQALLDALYLAREISKCCKPHTNWKEIGLRESVLNEFESEMINRSASKVKDSADAAKFLHSKIALHKSNKPRGSFLKLKK